MFVPQLVLALGCNNWPPTSPLRPLAGEVSNKTSSALWVKLMKHPYTAIKFTLWSNNFRFYLAGSFNSSEKIMEFVSWEYYSQYIYMYIWKHKIQVPNHQLAILLMMKGISQPCLIPLGYQGLILCQVYPAARWQPPSPSWRAIACSQDPWPTSLEWFSSEHLQETVHLIYTCVGIL